MCTSDTGFRSCVIYSGDKLFIARYVKTALLYLSLSGFFGSVYSGHISGSGMVIFT